MKRGRSMGVISILGATMLTSCGRVWYDRQPRLDGAATDAVVGDGAVLEARGDVTSDRPVDQSTDAALEVPSNDAGPADAVLEAPSSDAEPADAALDVPSNDAGPADAASDGAVGDCVPGTLCSLRETFDQSPLNPQLFAYTDGTCATEISGGSFRISTTGVSGRYCGLVSMVGFSPSGTLVIDSAAFPARVSGYVVYLELRDAASHGVELQLSLGALNMNLKDAAGVTKVGSVTYDVAVHRYWRFRVDATRVWYESSADSAVWTTLLTISSPFTGDVTVNFGAGNVIAGPAATASLPGLNAD